MVKVFLPQAANFAIIVGFATGWQAESFPGKHHETHLSTLQNTSCTHPRFPGSHENPWRPRCHRSTPCQGSQAPGPVSPALTSPCLNGGMGRTQVASPTVFGASFAAPEVQAPVSGSHGWPTCGQNSSLRIASGFSGRQVRRSFVVCTTGSVVRGCSSPSGGPSVP